MFVIAVLCCQMPSGALGQAVSTGALQRDLGSEPRGPVLMTTQPCVNEHLHVRWTFLLVLLSMVKGSMLAAPASPPSLEAGPHPFT